jgi:leucyl/phenylalanyl-tRNA--protein transferase
MVLAGYARGLFPWAGEAPIPWCSPDPRMVLSPVAFRASRRLRRLARRRLYRVTVDHAFGEVMRACATIARPGQDETWIGGAMFEVYGALHRRGIAHSLEVWQGSELQGGLYGLSLGLAFFGESMFSRRPDTSKLALWVLCARLAEKGFHLIDCQQDTPHLRSLGAAAIPRREFLARLERAIAAPSPTGSWREWPCEPPEGARGEPDLS